MKKLLGIYLIAILFIASCIKPPDYPDEPVIEFVSVGKTSLLQNTDTTLITISFTDGDGDLGLEDSETDKNFILTDTRTGFQEFYKIPFIPQQGVGNGISGEIAINVLAQCCVPTNGVPCQPNPGQPPENIVYTIQIKDRAGNLSNMVTMPPLELICD